ncbi:MAG: PorV/PorQ family protein [Candidatus Krumholzibacteriota bacterium]|nr:PorV/PorQ family protein [Candidatus Krumholzibacteriota bacterium]
MALPRQLLIFLILLVGAPGATGDALAQTKAGTTIAQFLGIETSAQHAGFGNAGAALAEGIESVYFNPGVIGFLWDTEFQFTHSLWFADIRFDYAAVAVPVRGWGTIFGSVTALNSGDIAVRTVESPLGTGEYYSVGNTAIGLGFGRQVTRRFAAGVQINYVSERIWHTYQNTITLDIGTIYAIRENGLQMGFSLTNAGTGSRYAGRDLAIQYDNTDDIYGDNSALPGEQLTDNFPVPILFRFGLSYPYQLNGDWRLLLLADALHPNDNAESVNLGIEGSWRGNLALRLGYQTLFQTDSGQGLTLGVGIRSRLGDRRLRFDYGWTDHIYLEETHRFTIAVGL